MTLTHATGQAAAELVAAHPLLGLLPREAGNALAAGATRSAYATAETMFYEGDAATHCLLVQSGAVEVLRYDAQGDERMLHWFGCGQLVGETTMFMPHGLYPMSGRSRGDTVVWRIGRRALRDACTQWPALALGLLEVCSQRLYHRVNEVDWLTSSNAQQRLAAYLIAQSLCQGGQRIELPTSQRHLAAHLGVRAETLSRMLADWQVKGWLQGERRQWTLRELSPLQALAAPAARSF